jgi:hypothetical protein
MVGTGRFELPTPRTPSECSTRLSHVPTTKESPLRKNGVIHNGKFALIITLRIEQTNGPQQRPNTLKESCGVDLINNPTPKGGSICIVQP